MAAVPIRETKPVVATVESVDVAVARARIGGTVVDLRVTEGDVVAPGQVVAVVGDDKLALQLGALDAQIAATRAQQTKTQDDYRRAQELFRNGTIAKARLDETRAAFEIADNQLKSATAQRSVIDQQVKEGQILAPAAGRVLAVPMTKGMVIQPGEVAARIAADSYILRLQLPERHAAALTVGAPVQLDDGRIGTLRQIYPEIIAGRVQADAEVDGLGRYFVGQRIGVQVQVGTRPGILLPPAYIRTLAGVDYVRLKTPTGPHLIPVQRGATYDGTVEILAGLVTGDVVLADED